MYVRCGSIADARQVFENMPKRNVFSWTLILAGYEKHGQSEEAVKLFWQMEQQGVIADHVTFVSVLKACTRVTSLEQGKQIHDHIIKCGIKPNAFVFNALVDMYAKCGSMVDAVHVFDHMDERGVVSWNSIISGCVHLGHHMIALNFFQQMKDECLKPDEVTLVCILKSCGCLMGVEEGRQIHIHILESGYEMNPYIGSTLVDFYAKCGHMDIACQVFNRMLERDVVSWNAMIAGYANHGRGEDAFRTYRGFQKEGAKPDEVTFMNILNACVGLGFLEQGRCVHAHAIEVGKECNVSVGNSLIDMYGKCQSLEDAVLMFGKLPDRNIVSWNTMITGYSQAGCNEEAVKLFNRMQKEHVKPNEVTFVSGLHACSLLAGREEGQTIHAQAVNAGHESSIRVGNTLIDMYSKRGHLEDALQVFDMLPNRDVVSWNVMITGYVQHGHSLTAIEMLQEMQQDGLKPNEVSFINGISACASLASLEHGLAIHTDAVKAGYEADMFVGSTIVDMYVKCESMHDARDVFDKMPEKVSAAWNTIIAGYGDNGGEEEALKLFNIMQTEEVMLDEFTFVSILNACASICALEEGKCIYCQYVKVGYSINIFVGSALVDMYAKCGQVEDARHVFDEVQDRDLFLWTVMIAGYAQHGYHQEVFELWEKMQKEGVKPDGTIYVCVLSACSHVGLVDKGLQLFNSMTQDHGISPSIDHFACFVDLLGRAGCLNEAEHFIKKLPIQPDAAVWRTLLGACRNHGNLELAELASSRLLKLEPNDSAAYVFLSNTYAAVGSLSA